MTTDEVRTLTREMFDDFARRDMEGFAAKLDDDVDWLFHAPIAIFPFAGARRGRAAVMASMRELDRDYTLERQVVDVLIAEGDRAAVLADLGLLQRATDRQVRLRMVHLHRYRANRLVEYRGFMDSFDAAEQALGRWMDLSAPPRP